jgi:Head domain of trimeric autotransporter adhesin/YadA-like membrane anchor domain
LINRRNKAISAVNIGYHDAPFSDSLNELFTEQIMNANFSKFSLFFSAAAGTFVFAAGANAQVPSNDIPYRDADCPVLLGGPPEPVTVPPCTTTSGRTNGPATVTITSVNGTTSRVTATQNIAYSGNLLVAGSGISINPNVASFQVRPSDVFLPNIATINVTAEYLGTYFADVSNTNAAALQNMLQNNPIARFNNYNFTKNIVNSISVDVFDRQVGGDFLYSLYTPDTRPVNGTVALAGRFQNDNRLGAITFGVISGTATLVTSNGPQVLTNAPTQFNQDGIQTGAWLSPYSLKYNITSRLTTVLDEFGLTTPTITVTDGINMNFSQIRNLANGVDLWDAVNVNQLNSVAANAALAQFTANTALARTQYIQINGSGNVPVAGGANAIAIGSNSNAASADSVAIGNGAIANGGAAVAIGLGNQATGNGAVAIGDPNFATGTGAVAIGANNVATGDGAVAIGNLAVANGAGNVALGNGAQALAANSVALGGGSIANQDNTVSVGAVGNERRIVNVAAGTGANDAVNVEQLVGEATTRANNDAVLQANINGEATIRANADVQLATAIQTESMIRAQQMLQVNHRISLEEAARASLGTALSNEINARLAGDLALSGRIDGLAGRLDQMDSRLAEFDDRLASGTAIASAMGGAAFLPDMKFNLTANVATYDGAHAGAFQLGVLVSPNAAINAGVATGFNKRGKTAARVGVTFGW